MLEKEPALAAPRLRAPHEDPEVTIASLRKLAATVAQTSEPLDRTLRQGSPSLRTDPISKGVRDYAASAVGRVVDALPRRLQYGAEAGSGGGLTPREGCRDWLWAYDPVADGYVLRPPGEGQTAVELADRVAEARDPDLDAFIRGLLEGTFDGRQRKTVIELADTFDMSGDGTISAYEFRDGCGLMGFHRPPETLLRIFKFFDHAGRGRLTQTDFTEVIHSLVNSFRSAKAQSLAEGRKKLQAVRAAHGLLRPGVDSVLPRPPVARETIMQGLI